MDPARTTRSLPHSMITELPKKKPNGTGRKKIEIKKIENNSSRKVAFSKRRKGMFKKADELCRLCDVEIAIILFSLKGRPYSFGDHVIDKFLAKNEDELVVVTKENVSVEEMHGEEEEEEEEEEFWWEQSIEEMNLAEIKQYKSCLEELRYNVSLKLEEMVMRRTCEDFLSCMYM